MSNISVNNSQSRNINRPQIISIANQKGGVAKTTTAINLAASLALSNLQTLLIDLDPQGNASTGLGITQENRTKSMYDVIIGRAKISDAAISTSIQNLDIVPCDINLSAAEIDLLSVDNKEFAIKNSISELNKKYDYIIIDCPPSLGQLTINALAASTGIIIPMQCEFYALEGLSHLLKTIDIIQKRLNDSLKIMGILLTMHDKRNRLTEEVENDVRGYLGDVVFKTVIPRNVRVSEAPSYGMSVLAYDPYSAGAKAYVAFSEEFLAKVG